MSATHVSYDRDAVAFNRTVVQNQRTLAPIILLVFCQPPERTQWVSVSQDGLILYKACYWYYVTGSQTEKTSQVVRIPRTQLFSPAELTGTMQRISRGETPSQPSIAALLEAVEPFLQNRGWVKLPKGSNPRATVYEGPLALSGNRLTVVLPAYADVLDAEERIEAVMRTMAILEGDETSEQFKKRIMPGRGKASQKPRLTATSETTTVK